jgi:hypothetical protein
METAMSYPLEPITSVSSTSLSASYFILASPDAEVGEVELILRRKLAERQTAPTPIYSANAIDQDYLGKQKIFDAVKDLYLSNNPRNRQVADRLISLHRDALTEDEHVDPDSIPQFAKFFLTYSDVGLPKITLTPDGTLRARWLHGYGDFIAIEFTGKPLAKVVAEIPRERETARYFFSELIESVAPVASSLGASFA